MMKSVKIGALAAILSLASPLIASAHAVVKPAEVGVAAYQTFTLGVPVEKDVPTTNVRLVLPENIGHVTPNVKPGWKIEIKKEKTGKQVTDDDGVTRDEEKVTEVIWSGGYIPAGQRDEFIFSAQAPATEGLIAWKAYQTYGDGTVVAWDNARGLESYPENAGPYSETKVVNDLAPLPVQGGSDSTTLAICLASLAISIVALMRTRRMEQSQ